MGDARFVRHFERLLTAEDPAAILRTYPDHDVIAALAASSRAETPDPFLANVLATEAQNRIRRARTAVHHLGEGLVLVDRHARITDVNPAAERLLGWRRSELLGKPVHETLHHRRPDGSPYPASECGNLSVLRTRVARHEPDDYFVRKDGELLPVSITVAPVLTDGEVEGAVFVFRDNTVRKAADARVAESERLFRATFEEAAVGLAHVALDGRWLRVNLPLCDIVGYSREELLHLTFQDITHPDDLDADLGHVRSLLAGEAKSYRMEKRYLHKAGHVVWIELTGALVRDAEGRPDYFIAAVQDISRSKAAEEAVAARARQQAAVADLGVAALGGSPLRDLMDRAVRAVADILDVEYAKILEILPEEPEVLLVAGVGWREGLVGAERVPTSKDSQAGYTLSSRRPVVVEDLASESRFRGPALLREHGVVSGMSVVIHGGEGGRPYGVFGAHSTRRRAFSEDDVHFLQAVANVVATAIERRRGEEALRSARAESERLVEERTRELTEANRALRSTNESLEAFAYLVSHDLKEPVRALDALLDALQEDHAHHLPDEGCEELAATRRAARRLATLVDGLLEWSRAARAGGDRLERVVLHEAMGSETARARFEALARERRARLDVQLPVEHAARATPAAVSQILGNLVLNAVRHNPRPDPLVRVRSVLREGTHGGREVEVVVEDDGPGFSAAGRARIESDDAGTASLHGSGFGLIIVRRVAEQFGGRVWLGDSPEGGAAVHVALPAA